MQRSWTDQKRLHGKNSFDSIIFKKRNILRGTKLVYDLRHLKYEQRLAKLELSTLVVWHNQTLKSNSLTSEGPASGILGHQHRMTKQFTKTKQRDNFLTKRIVNSWNEMPAELTNAESINSFKNSFYYLKMKYRVIL